MTGQLVGVRNALEPFVLPLLNSNKLKHSLGISENGKTVVAAIIAKNVQGPTLLLTTTPTAAERLTSEISFYCTEMPVMQFPEREQKAYDNLSIENSLRTEREKVLRQLRRREQSIIVASWIAAAELQAGPDATKKERILNIRQQLKPITLLRWAESHGYKIKQIADTVATVTQRGGIVDIFPVNHESPYRLEFLDDTIESIRKIEPSTQRSRGRFEKIRIAPAEIVTQQNQSSANNLLKTLKKTGEKSLLILNELELIQTGKRPRNFSFYEPFLNTETLVEHLHPSGTLILDQVELGQENLLQILEHEHENRKQGEEKGDLPKGLPPLHKQADLFLHTLTQKKNKIILERFGTEERGTERIPIGAAQNYAGQLKLLIQDANKRAQNSESVIIASQQGHRLLALLQEEGIPSELVKSVKVVNEGTVTICPSNAMIGFTIEGKIALITDENIFGLHRRPRRIRKNVGIQQNLLGTLKPKDLVVHAEHGIGRFLGLVRRTTDGREREYFDLQYAAGDHVYVPTDYLDSLTPYVGPSNRSPTITRLGTQEWARTKQRVQKDIIANARDLLDLYAQRALAKGYAFGSDTAWQQELEGSFPFVETPDQNETISAIKQDMEKTQPMDRLIAGDVGYGKTEIAIRAAFKAVTHGKQVAVLAPTTVLAEQHGETFRERLSSFPIKTEVLSRFRDTKSQKEIIQGIDTGSIDITIGTHRLLQKDIEFNDLGLVIIDEEQRFGVNHKDWFKKVRKEVDTLTMSATPIPRTLQMSLAGIRDISTLMTPPEERQPVKTYISEWDDDAIRKAILQEIDRDGQIYFVHNRVSTINKIAKKLNNLVPEATLAIAHGQMQEEKLEQVMYEFSRGTYDILLCTTIIESGLDLPNVNTILIDKANRFGLAQLYQLRGRVGRGSVRAYAHLLHDKTQNITEPAQQRLEAIFQATELGSGFQIALRDLEIRGAGNVLGSEQSGHIAAIGFQLYSRLMGEAVAALKRGLGINDETTQDQTISVQIDVPLSASIPETYLEDTETRLAIYERITHLKTTEEILELQEELNDRYGPPPPLVQQLLTVVRLKILAHNAKMQRVSTSARMLHIHSYNGLTTGQKQLVNSLNLKCIFVGPEQIRIDRIEAGSDWLQILEQVLRELDNS